MILIKILIVDSQGLNCVIERKYGKNPIYYLPV